SGAQPAALPPPYPPYPPPEVTHPHRVFALTISPLHLLSPILELTGEIRASDKIGVAVVAGAGKYSETDNGVKLSASVYEAGAQFRYYVVGDFRHGMQLGAELLYLHLSDSNLSAKGEGLAIGPFAGYKYTTDIGFTVDTQLGFERITARAAAGTSTASNSDYIVLLNINVGWSF
ncbi:MAG TPA: hypothetical protein VNO55_30370, partial [Polyangia bacterium]|nr:hypothetical protein [Polyangia bacterium]